MTDTRYIGIILFSISFCGFLSSSSAHTTPCAHRVTSDGHICVCNATYCDYLEPISPQGKDGLVVTSSSKGGLMFSRKLGKFSNRHMKVHDWMEHDNIFPAVPEEVKDLIYKPSSTISINRNEKRQKIIGFGGALSTAVSHNLDLLKPEVQDAVYKSYFANDGIRYTMMRLSIGASDFDLFPWAYNEQPTDDLKLSNFTKLNSIDDKKVQQIKRLKSVSKLNNLRAFATAWSSPRWMKTSNAWSGFSLLIKKYYQTWADYHLRFIELMEGSGIPIWGITTGNQPSGGTTFTSKIKFLSLGWTAEQQANWVADNLGPTIRKSKFKHVKILCNDGFTWSVPGWYFSMNFTRPDSMQYIDGFASHWYYDSLFRREYDFTHHLFPDKMFLNTESTLKGPPPLGKWEQGEKYADTYIKDLQHQISAFIDWNMVLNEKGGPSYDNSASDSAIVANVTSGQEVYKQPIFYAIGHFSRFVPENSIRIKMKRTNTKIEGVAFQRPDGIISCVLLNKENKAQNFNLVDSERGTIRMTIPAKSLHTIEYK